MHKHTHKHNHTTTISIKLPHTPQHTPSHTLLYTIPHKPIHTSPHTNNNNNHNININNNNFNFFYYNNNIINTSHTLGTKNPSNMAQPLTPSTMMDHLDIGDSAEGNQMQQNNYNSTLSTNDISFITHSSPIKYFKTPNPQKTLYIKLSSGLNHTHKNKNNTTQASTKNKIDMYIYTTHTSTNTHKLNKFFNNLIHPPHTSNFYFLKSGTSPSCQIFNQAWGHIKQQLPLTGSMCVHTGCAPRTLACMHTRYTVFSQKTQITHQKHPNLNTTIAVNLTAHNLNTPQPTPKPPPLFRHTCTQCTGIYTTNNLIHPPHTSNFYFFKSRTSPSCQIFNQAWRYTE